MYELGGQLYILPSPEPNRAVADARFPTVALTEAAWQLSRAAPSDEETI